MVPSQLEAAIARSRFVDQVCVHGDNLPHNIAIIVPNWANVSLVLSSLGCFLLIIVSFKVIDRLALSASASREELAKVCDVGVV